MTLREEAEKAAREIPHYGGPAYPVQAIADAIERVARAFAERAVREYQAVIETKGIPEHVDDIQRCVERAIEEAERGE